MWGLPSTEKIHSAEDWFILLGYDADSSIPEEDLNYIQQLINTPVAYSDVVLILTGTSVLPVSDLDIILKAKNMNNLKSNNQLSIATQRLMNSIRIVEVNPLKLSIKEKIAYQDGIRHDWRAIGNFGNYDFGILLEKDPGEQNIFDHNSVYLKWNSSNMKFIAGDHQLIGGFGLVAWRTTSVHKGFETINTLPRQGKGIKGYRSSNEYWNTRGFGVEQQTQYGKFTYSLGRTYQDGSLEGEEIKLDKTGLHITQHDLLKQNQLVENAATVMWNNNYTSYQLGVLLNAQSVGDNDGGNIQHSSVSIFTSEKQNDLHWFGETAFNNNLSIAFLGGVLFRSGTIKYLISLRYYPANFRTYRAQPFSEWQGQNEGEKGIFQNVQLKYVKHVISIYSDIAEKIDENTLTTSNNIKYESGIRWQWFGKKHRFKTQLRKSNQLQTTQIYFPNPINYDIYRTTAKGQYQYQPTKNLDVRWQINSTFYNNESQGLGIETRFNWEIPNFVITGSWITANVDDYNGRVYFWDLNLPGEMRSLAVSDEKQLLGLKIKMKSKNNYQIYMRWRSAWDSMNFSGTADQRYALAIQIIL